MRGRFWMARGWQDHPLFAREPYTRAQVWCWLVEMAAWKPARKEIGSKTITLKRGQLSYSTRYMAKAWRWGGEAKVRRFLCVLVEWENIAVSTDAGQTIITICNYNKYQNDARDTDAPATQERRTDDSKIDALDDAVMGLLSACNGDENQDGQEDTDAPTDAAATQGMTQNRRKKREELISNIDGAFEKFWDLYPSRSPASNPKKLALDAFRRKVEAGALVEDILRGVEGFAAAVKQQQRQDGEKYNPRGAVCQAVTFLNQERYNDYGTQAEKPLTEEQRAVLARHSGDGQGDTVPNVVSIHTSKPGER